MAHTVTSARGDTTSTAILGRPDAEPQPTCNTHAADSGTVSARFLFFAGIEDLREKREQILKQINDEEMEKQRIQQELAGLTQRLSRINESLARKVGPTRLLSSVSSSSIPSGSVSG